MSSAVYVRVSPALKRYIEEAATADLRSVSSFILKACILEARAMRAKGQFLKPEPSLRSERGAR